MEDWTGSLLLNDGWIDGWMDGWMDGEWQMFEHKGARLFGHSAGLGYLTLLSLSLSLHYPTISVWRHGQWTEGRVDESMVLQQLVSPIVNVCMSPNHQVGMVSKVGWPIHTHPHTHPGIQASRQAGTLTQRATIIIMHGSNHALLLTNSMTLSSLSRPPAPNGLYRLPCMLA